MKTFILEWDPARSNYTDEDFERDIRFLEFGDFNWCVWDHEKARSGDNFYMIRCGQAPTGIVMKGFFISDPFPGRDSKSWRRRIYYMNMRPTFMVLPSHPRGIISTGILEQTMPAFKWNGGYSGRELPEAYRVILDDMWEEYEARFRRDDLDGKRADRSARPEAGIDEAVALASEALFDRKDPDGAPAILRSLASGLAGRTQEERIRGFLESVINGAGWTAGEIRERGFSEGILDSLVY